MAQFIPYGEHGLFDEFLQELDVAAFETPLLRVGKVIDWAQFAPELRAAIAPQPAKGPGGRPRFEPLFMFKVLVLQSLHGLADDAVSYQITDRHSFRAFLGLTPADLVPDGQTIADFRAALTAAGSFQRLFEAFLRHLQQGHGLALARAGVIVDATFVEVPRQRNTREENAQIKAGAIPPTFAENPKLRAHKDTDARWTKKDFRSYYGYKHHCKVDVADKLILAAQVPAANVHDSRVFAELVQPGDGSVHAELRLPKRRARRRPRGQSGARADQYPRHQNAPARRRAKRSQPHALKNPQPGRARLRADARQHARALGALHRPGAQHRLHPARQPRL